MAEYYTNRTCGTCRHRDKQQLCRKGPPQMTNSRIIRAKYPVVEEDFPACSFYLLKV
jgi:hypothetical protein